MSKWDRVQGSFARGHDDLFSDSAYNITLYSYTAGSYDPDKGEMTNLSREKIAELDAEIIPPTMDTTVDVDGTSLGFDTSIRFPIRGDTLTVADGDSVTIASGETEEYDSVTVDSGGTLTVDGTLIVYDTVTQNGTLTVNGNLATFGESNLSDAITLLGEDADRPTEVEINQPDNSTEIYELHGYIKERGSDMLMCRLVEQ